MINQNCDEYYICKVECIFPMVILSEFRMRQNKDDGHREDAPHFIKLQLV